MSVSWRWSRDSTYDAGQRYPERSIGGSGGVPTVSRREGEAEPDWSPRRGRREISEGSPRPPATKGSPRSHAERGGTPGRRHSLGLVVAMASLIIFLASLPAVAAQVSDDEVREIAFQLRCVVCQNLSVADSPSETASQMRQIIRERLALGESREQVLAYFVSKYGEWILLSPPRRGFNLVVWGLPFAGLVAGFVVIAIVARRWSRSRREESVEAVDPAYRERVRRELQEFDR